MTDTLRLTLEPIREQEDTLEAAAVLACPEGKRHRLWWRLPALWRDALTTWADPFVVGFLFVMMQEHRDVMVEGPVSPSLLTNVEQYMALWHAWAPNRYQPVAIRAREEAELPVPSAAEQAIMPFSCGVDSCYTLLRHQRGLAGRRSHQIGAAMVMGGFDIRLDRTSAQGKYNALMTDTHAALEDAGLACIDVTSNFHELPTTWGHSFGTQLIGSLHLLAGRFGATVVANDVPYTRMGLTWGSHPVSNPFLGSERFRVIDDGAETTRFGKIESLTQWPEAMRRLRVCFSEPGSYANCCRCEKCLRTILSCRVAGVPLPEAFGHDPDNRRIRWARFHNWPNVLQWREVVAGAEARDLGDADWVKAARAAIVRNRIRLRTNRIKRAFIPLRNRIRTRFRGSPLSRSQLQAP